MPSSITRALLTASWLLPAASAAVVDLPIWYRNTYADVEVKIGTPPISYLLRFDTGSATTWMQDVSCTDACPNVSGFNRTHYNASASSTSGSLGTYAEIEYLGGLTTGHGLYDEFALGDVTWNQTFMSANASSWAQTAADGMLGLAFSSIADAGASTLVETMMQDGLLDKPRFGIYYGKEDQDTNGPGEGVLTIGGSREEKYVDGNFTWVPLERYNGEYAVWRTTLASISGTTTSANGTSKETDVNLGAAWAVVDTGAGRISVPEDKVDEIYASIGMNYRDALNGRWIPSCSEFNSSWSISFNFKAGDEIRELKITGDQLAQPGFANRADACWPPFDGGNNSGFTLIGSSLLEKLYTVFDFGAFEVPQYQPQVGFAQLKPEYKNY